MCAIGGIITTSKLLSAQPTACDGMEMDVLSAVILGERPFPEAWEP